MKTMLMVAAILVAFTTTSFARYEIPSETQAELHTLCDAVFSLQSAQTQCFTKETTAIRWMHRYNKAHASNGERQDIVVWCENRTKNEAGFEKMFRLKRCIKRRNNATF